MPHHTPSTRIRIMGGPIEVLNGNAKEAEEALAKMIPGDATLRLALLALIRRLLSQAILDAYEAGRQSKHASTP